MQLENSYHVLGLRRDAELSDIKSAFRRLALEYHPDRNKDPEAGARFTEINEAYSLIMDSQGVVDSWTVPDVQKDPAYEDATTKLSFKILTDREVVFHVPPVAFETQIRRRFSPTSAPGTFCKVGKRWFEVDDHAQSGNPLLRWRSVKSGTLIEWYKSPDGGDEWKSTRWDDFWSFVRGYASQPVA